MAKRLTRRGAGRKTEVELRPRIRLAASPYPNIPMEKVVAAAAAAAAAVAKAAAVAAVIPKPRVQQRTKSLLSIAGKEICGLSKAEYQLDE